MGDILKQRLKMSKFESPQQEAILGLAVAASHLRLMLEKIAAQIGISPEQYNILRILRGVYPNGHACGEISNRMLDRSPDVTRRIDALVKQGYVERTRSEEDRRVVVTRISERGMELLEKAGPIFKATELERFADFSDEECHELTRLCEKVIEKDIKDCEVHQAADVLSHG